MDSKSLLGLEIGGTGIKLAISDSSSTDVDSLVDQLSSGKLTVMNFDTKIPQETFILISEELKKSLKVPSENLLVGVSMFGPLEMNKNSPDYGKVIQTPKEAWRNANIIDLLVGNLGVKRENIFLDIDVGCAAILEHRHGKHNVNSLAYITIGTGVGVGLIINGQVVHGLQHPEGGHITVKRHEKDSYRGCCSIHGDCLEGLITNNAIVGRLGLNSVSDCEKLEDTHEVWDIIANYIAQHCLTLLYTVSVEKIIIGGGIINREILLPKIRQQFISLNNNYIVKPLIFTDEYIVRTAFKNNSGLLSALILPLEP